jgi:anaerobic magnesium-protoporphyrin IX monomethyl ester cyclase
MKIQFIWPNFDCPIGPSIGISYISGALKAAGHDTRILHICEWLDYPFDLDRIESDVSAYDPDLIAVGTGFTHYPEMGQAAQRLKKALGKPIIFGGIHTTLNTKSVMEENPSIDFGNVGEGDDSMLDLVHALDTGGDTSTIPNIWARKDGIIAANPSRRLKDISKIPWMDLEGWQFKRIMENRRGWVNVYMNRGCPYRCTYCHNNGVAKILQENFKTKTSSDADLGYIRLRSIDDMLGELKDILRKYDVSAFSFNDDTFTMAQEHMKAFLARYKKEIGVPFVCNTTVIDVDREMLEVMKEANCDLVRFGVETATQRIRKDVMKRDFSMKKTEEVFKICREIGLRSFAFNIIANPTETLEEMKDTLHLNCRLLPDGLKISLGYPFPGTEYHAIAKSLDLVDESKHIHNFIHDTKLKWTDDDRLWIDKVRCLFWWWMNVYLDNEASPLYAELVKMLETMPAEEWQAPETERRMWDLDDALSSVVKIRGITHYTIPFKDRPEIAILALGNEQSLNKEVLDPH